MGKASKENRANAIARASSVVKEAIFGKVGDTKDAMVEDVRNRIGLELIKGCVKLVKEDIKHGKVKDVEQYVKTSMESVRKPKVMDMLHRGKVAPEEIEATIRQTLKENYAGKV